MLKHFDEQIGSDLLSTLIKKIIHFYFLFIFSSYGESSNRLSTESSVVFTINPPQCQMEIRRGFGIAGTRTSGPVTVGDPLTLLIHMKSEKGKIRNQHLISN